MLSLVIWEHILIADTSQEGCHWPSCLSRHAASSCPASWRHTHTSPFLRGSFLATLPPAWSTAWVCCGPGEEPSTLTCWTSHHWPWPIKPDPSAEPSYTPADSTLQPNLVSYTNWLRAHSIPSFRSLMKRWNRTGPNTEPWGTLLVTVCQLDETQSPPLSGPRHPASFYEVNTAHVQAMDY